jgi:uncharacterized surface protein with fasciclin (FAS1) repeats
LLIPPGIKVYGSIFAEANATGQFNVLGSLLEGAGLLDDVTNPGPITVFAPTDEAFAKLTNLDEISQDPALVLAILTNHVLSGYYPAASLSNGMVLRTLVGGYLNVSISENVMISGATVVLPDIFGSNGVVHGIGT